MKQEAKAISKSEKISSELSRCGLSFQKAVAILISGLNFTVTEEFPTAAVKKGDSAGIKHQEKGSALDILAIKDIGRYWLFLLVETKSNVRNKDVPWVFIHEQNERQMTVDQLSLENKPVTASGEYPRQEPEVAHLGIDIGRPTSTSRQGLRIRFHTSPENKQESDSERVAEGNEIFYKACKQIATAEYFLLWQHYDYLKALVDKRPSSKSKPILFLPFVVTDSELYKAKCNAKLRDIPRSNPYIKESNWKCTRVDQILYHFALPPHMMKEYVEVGPPRKQLQKYGMDVLFSTPTRMISTIRSLIRRESTI